MPGSSTTGIRSHILMVHKDSEEAKSLAACVEQKREATKKNRKMMMVSYIDGADRQTSAGSRDSTHSLQLK